MFHGIETQAGPVQVRILRTLVGPQLLNRCVSFIKDPPGYPIGRSPASRLLLAICFSVKSKEFVLRLQAMAAAE